MPLKKHALTIRLVLWITLNQKDYCVKKSSISDRSCSNDWFYWIVFKRNGRFKSTNQSIDQELWRNLTWGNINDIFAVEILIQRNFSALHRWRIFWMPFSLNIFIWPNIFPQFDLLMGQKLQVQATSVKWSELAQNLQRSNET